MTNSISYPSNFLLAKKGEYRASTAMVVACSVLGLTLPHMAVADCNTAGTTVTCDADVSAGSPTIAAPIDTIIVQNTTSVFGGAALTLDTDATSVSVDADFGAFGFQNDPAGTSQTSRLGIDLNADDGEIDVDLGGPITISAGEDETTSGGAAVGVVRNHHSGLNVRGVNVTVNQDGAMVVNHANVNANGATITVADAELFYGIDLRATGAAATPGNVNLTRTGDLTVNGADLNTATIDGVGANRALSGGTSGTVSNVLGGLYLQADGDVNISNTGNFSVFSGSRSATANAGPGERAEALVNQSSVYGITMTQAANGGVSLLDRIDDIPENVIFNQTGDVSVTLEDSTLAAISQFVPGGAESSAFIRSNSFLQQTAGIRLENGLNLTAGITGNVVVDGGTITGMADSLVGGANTEGRATAAITGQTVTGFLARSIKPVPVEGVEVDSSADISIAGNVTATGTNISLNLAATGQAQRATTGFPPDSTGSEQDNEILGGNAVALSVSQFDNETLSPSPEDSSLTVTERVPDIDLTLDGTYAASGGDMTAQVSGSGTQGRFAGGTARTLVAGVRGLRLNASDATELQARGGDVNLTFVGDHGENSVEGGFAIGFSGALQSDTNTTWNNNVTTTGGDAFVVGTFASATDSIVVAGGRAEGLNVSLQSTLTPTEEGNLSPEALASLRNRQLIVASDIVAVGGDASADAVAALGGKATGIIAASPTNLTVTGNVTATAGSGSTFDGAVTGVSLGGSGAYFPGVVPLDNPESTLRIAGSVNATGQGVDIADSYLARTSALFDASHTGAAGLRVNIVGFGKAIVQDGGVVRSEGDYVHGVVLAAERNALTVETGGLIEATGTNASAIEVRPYQDFEFAVQGSAQGTAAEIVVAQGGRVISQQGAGLVDDERRVALESRSDGNFPIVETYANNTTVDVAGTISGGNGVAIDLGTGEDRVNLRNTSVTTGNVLLGEGNDTLQFENGFTLNGEVNGGGGTDIIEIDVAASQVQTFDFVDAPIDGFEILVKNGEGLLNLSGATILDPLLVEAVDGQTAILSSQQNVTVEVSQGASLFSQTHLATVFNGGDFGVGSTLSGTRGMLTLSGDLSLGSEGTLHVDIEAPDQSDLIAVSGTTTLDGTLAVNALGAVTSFVPGQDYTIIQSTGAVSGSFSAITDNLPDLDIAQSTVANGAGGGNVVLALTGGDPVDPIDPVEPVDPVDPPVVLNLSDKSIHPNATQAAAGVGVTFGNILLDHADGNDTSAIRFGGTSTQNQGFSFAQDFGAPENFVWFTPFATRSEVDTTPTATGYRSSIGGVSIGFEQRRGVSAGPLIWGAAISVSDSSVSSGASSADIRSHAIGFYSSLESGDLTVSGGLSYGKQDHETTRSVSVGGTTILARGQADGSFTSVSGKLSYDLTSRVGWKETSHFAPFIKLNHTRSRRDGFVETGAGALNLTVDSDTFSGSALSIGVETATQYRTGNGGTMRPYADISIAHVFGDQNTITGSSIAGVDGANFLSDGALESRNRLNIGLGVDMAISDNVSANMSYDGSFSKNFVDHKASISIAMRF